MIPRALSVILLAALLANRAWAQQCDDFDACTANDMCIGGECLGSFDDGGGCDDLDACTVDDRCQMDPIRGPICRGVPAPQGTVCGGGCGTCLPVVGTPSLIVCGGNPKDHGAPCDLGVNPCIGGSCVIVNFLASCVPKLRECPDTDGNPCTDSCDFATGECRPDVPKCVPTCERCNTSTGACEPANLGAACDDGDICTDRTRCEFNDQARRSFCVVGVPIGPSPTPTSIAATPTAPPTPTVPRTATASRTFTLAPTATAAATRSAVPTLTAAATVTAVPTLTVAPTLTAPPTLTVLPPTLTVAPTLTVPPTLITPSTPRPCVGDCDRSGAVIVNELITGVRILLGREVLSQCPAFDADSSGAVEVHELIAGVQDSINGCE